MSFYDRAIVKKIYQKCSVSIYHPTALLQLSLEDFFHFPQLLREFLCDIDGH